MQQPTSPLTWLGVLHMMPPTRFLSLQGSGSLINIQWSDAKIYHRLTSRPKGPTGFPTRYHSNFFLSLYCTWNCLFGNHSKQDRRRKTKKSLQTPMNLLTFYYAAQTNPREPCNKVWKTREMYAAFPMMLPVPEQLRVGEVLLTTEIELPLPSLSFSLLHAQNY